MNPAPYLSKPSYNKLRQGPRIQDLEGPHSKAENTMYAPGNESKAPNQS